MTQVVEVETTDTLQALLPGKARSVFLPILTALALSLATIVTLLLFTARTLDQQEQDGTVFSVRTGLAVEADRLGQVARDTSWWDEAILNLVVEPDGDWADDNIGGYLHEAFDLDLSLVLDGNDQARIAYRDGREAELGMEDPFLRGVALLSAKARASVDESPTPVSGYLLLGGVPYLVTASAFVYENAPGRSTNGSVLLLGKRLDQRLIAHLGELFRVAGLQLGNDAASTADPGITLSDPTGRAIAVLSWPKPSQAWSALAGVVPPLVAVVAAVVLLTWRFFAVELEQRRQNQALLARLATTDGLTGIANRRFFLERAQQEMERGRRFAHPLTVLMLDIDHFKAINDNYGHAAGDEALKSLTALVTGVLRQIDLFGRLGGEEFVILMPETRPHNAHEAADRIRRTVEENSVETEAGSIGFTVSIGLSEMAADDRDVHALLARADEALYAAKEGGRNRVIPWKPGSLLETS
jgi:diguanylate cyclase (GGDEF)-like protein